MHPDELRTEMDADEFEEYSTSLEARRELVGESFD
jgi:hypothetical protein